MAIDEIIAQGREISDLEYKLKKLKLEDEIYKYSKKSVVQWRCSKCGQIINIHKSELVDD